MASLVWAVLSALLGRARRIARARAWQWPRSSCRSSWLKTSRVGCRQAVSPDWTTFFTSCRSRTVTGFVPVRDAQDRQFHPRPLCGGVAGAWPTAGARGGGARAVRLGHRDCASPALAPRTGKAEGGRCAPGLGCSFRLRGVGWGRAGPVSPPSLSPAVARRWRPRSTRPHSAGPNEKRGERGLSNRKVNEGPGSPPANALGPVPALGGGKPGGQNLGSRSGSVPQTRCCPCWPLAEDTGLRAEER